MSSTAQHTGSEKPAILIPCYNRREITLSCLRQLHNAGIFDDYSVILIDDGSIDKTSQSVKEHFPQVEILFGDGNLFWTGAIELGMRHAFAAGASSFVWLNDDSKIERSAIDAIKERAEALGGIVSGQGKVEIKSQDFEWYFPLSMKGHKSLYLKDADLSQAELAADTCRGNLVAISRKVVDKIGFPDGKGVPHYGGDTDYGLRATAAGLPLRVLTAALVVEEGLIRNDNQSWLLGEQNVCTLLKNISSKRSIYYPPMIFIYNVRHWGLIGLLFAILTYVKLAGILILKICTPRSLRIRLFGKHSNAWKSLEVMRKDASA